MNDFDSPWKEALNLYFEAFLSLFFPNIHAIVNWSRGYEILDKELQQIRPESEIGRRVVDQLVKVWFQNGSEGWLLVHIEVQTSPDRDFAERMFVYYYRIFERFRRPVIGLAILADEHPNWRPRRYAVEHAGCSLEYRFPTVKLLDYAASEQALEAHVNPFAHVVLAHLKALETSKQPEDRLNWKVRLVKGLFDRGWSKTDVARMFRLLDWLMALPEAMEPIFWNVIKQFQEEKKMPFVTTPEKIGRAEGLKIGREEGRKEGRQEGRQEGLRSAAEMALEAHFGEDGKALAPALASVHDVNFLQALLQQLLKGCTLEEVTAQISQAQAP